MKNKRGQVTIFIIIAIFIIVFVAGYFALRGTVSKIAGIPESINPIYSNFLSCLEEELSSGIDILESNGGYIELPEFDPPSGYMPFSNQLDFLGNPIPYWYYISGNNIQKEQIPSKNEIEEQLERFMEEEARGCSPDNYYEQGFEINLGEPNVKVFVKDSEVEANIDMDFRVNKSGSEDVALIDEHKIIAKSDLGKLYVSAGEVYQKEQEDLFLENYAVDILRFYAPVDGVELSCAPEIWQSEEVFDRLGDAIEANTLALKTNSEKKDDYFVIDALKEVGSIRDSEINVRFLNSKNWPYSFEVSPSEQGSGVLIANPVGNQPGMGILGFCYVPYHFVYDIKYPVLIQLESEKTGEIFQFPLAVIIKGNKPREPLDSGAVEIEGPPELCRYKNSFFKVNTYDTKLNPVSADISYECLGVKCDIGKTSYRDSESFLMGEFPQCVNGFIRARAEGFEDSRNIFSTVSSSTETEEIDIILDRLYEREIDLKLDGKDYEGDAIISFISDSSSGSLSSAGGNSKTIIYPGQKTIELSEGQYEVQIQIYRNSDLKLPSSAKEQCIEIPESGIGGFFGFTKEKCFNIEIPEQIVSNALAGGGKENYYILESELENSNIIEIDTNSLPLPDSIERLQDNYILFEEQGLDIVFK